MTDKKRHSWKFLTDKNADNIVRIILIRRRRTADEFLAFSLFERMSERGDENVLEDFPFDFLRHRVVVENVDEFEKGFALPLDRISLGHFRFEEILEELKLRDEPRNEGAKKVEEQLQLIRMILDKVEDALDEQFGFLPVGEIDGIDVLVAALESLGDEDLEEIDGDVGVLRQPRRILLHKLVDDVDRLELDLVEDLRRQLRGEHAGKMTHSHVHQLSRIPLQKGTEWLACLVVRIGRKIIDKAYSIILLIKTDNSQTTPNRKHSPHFCLSM